MHANKRKRATARQARQALAPKPPVIVFLPRHPDDFEPRRPRAPRAPRRPPSRPAARPTLPTAPPKADGAPSRRTRAAVTARAGLPPHGRRLGRKTVDGQKLTRVGFEALEQPREGGAFRREYESSRKAPRVAETGKSRHRLLRGRPSDLPVQPSHKSHALPRADVDPELPVSKRRVRPTVHTTQPSTTCRSVRRRPWVKPRPVDRSKRYTKLGSPEAAQASGRSVPLNSVRKLIASIRATVHRLELLVGGAA